MYPISNVCKWWKKYPLSNIVCYFKILLLLNLKKNSLLYLHVYSSFLTLSLRRMKRANQCPESLLYFLPPPMCLHLAAKRHYKWFMFFFTLTPSEHLSWWYDDFSLLLLADKEVRVYLGVWYFDPDLKVTSRTESYSLLLCHTTRCLHFFSLSCHRIIVKLYLNIILKYKYFDININT